MRDCATLTRVTVRHGYHAGGEIITFVSALLAGHFSQPLDRRLPYVHHFLGGTESPN